MLVTCPDCGQQYQPLIGSPGGYNGHSCAMPRGAVEAGAQAAFWEDDMGGHIKGSFTWDTIPEEGRENYRKMVRAVLTAVAELHGKAR